MGLSSPPPATGPVPCPCTVRGPGSGSRWWCRALGRAAVAPSWPSVSIARVKPWPRSALLKWFYDTSTRAALEQPAVVLLWGRPLASWLLALGERSGYEDLRDSGRISVILYVHGRTELYCAQACLA
jgi:hypothetical protein